MNNRYNSMRKARRTEAKRMASMLYCHGMIVDWMDGGEGWESRHSLTGQGANLMARKIEQHRSEALDRRDGIGLCWDGPAAAASRGK